MNKKSVQLENEDILYFEESNSRYPQKYVLVTFICPIKEMKNKVINDLNHYINYITNTKIDEIINSIITHFNILLTNKIEVNDNKIMVKDLKDRFKLDEQLTYKQYRKEIMLNEELMKEL